ncbi:MAG: chaperone modulator CbpM [Burkholderiales bacterium]
MEIDLTDIIWQDDRHEVSFAELAELSGLSETELRQLVDAGVLVPNDPSKIQWSFGAHCVVTVRAVRRLRDDFELDPNALALALSFLDRIRDLEVQLGELRAQLPHRSP